MLECDMALILKEIEEPANKYFKMTGMPKKGSLDMTYYVICGVGCGGCGGGGGQWAVGWWSVGGPCCPTPMCAPLGGSVVPAFAINIHLFAINILI